MKTFSRHTVTFIVRFWVEYLEQTPPIWRGEIEHVGGEVMHFGNLREMNDCMHRHIMMQQPSSDRGKTEVRANEMDSGDSAD